MLTTCFIKKLLKSLAETMGEQRDYLIELDQVCGDGDLGLTMSDGFLAASNFAQSSEETDLGKLLYGAGKEMSKAVPSTMGTLMASGLMQAGKVLKGQEELAEADLYRLFEAYEEGVQLRGKAQLGEKTFLDGIHPAVEALKKAGQEGLSLEEACAKAAKGAEEGLQSTTTMQARHGRAATRGEASISLLDPGAAVAKLMFDALLNAVR